MTKPDPTALKKAFRNKVEKAYRQLETEGKKPTIEAVRQITGGSYSTLCPTVRAVKENREAERQQARALPDMPEDLKEAFEAACQHAYRLADENSVAAQKSFNAALESKDIEIREREGVVADLEKEIETLKEEISHVSQLHHDAQLEASEQSWLRHKAETECALVSAKLEACQSVLCRVLPQPDSSETECRDGQPAKARIETDEVRVQKPGHDRAYSV